MRLLFLFVAALIVYGTLYPWQFELDEARRPRFELRAKSRADVALNIAVYVPLGATAYLAAPTAWALSARLFTPVLFAFCFSVLLELLQLFQPGRVTSTVDVMTNVAGAAVGVLVARGVHRLPSLDVLALLACWGAWLVIPLLPGPGSGVTAAALWFVCGMLLRELGVNRWLTVVLLTGAATLSGSLVVGALTGAFAFAVLGRRFERRPEPGWLLLGLVALSGIAALPSASVENRFSWTPFSGSLAADWRYSVRVLVSKVLLYSACVWAIGRGRGGLWLGGGAVGAVLGLVEAAQTRIPGRTAEITDPLLAVLAAAVLFILRRRNARA